MSESIGSRLGREASEIIKRACMQARPTSRRIKTPGKLSIEAGEALKAPHGKNQTPYRYGRTIKDRPAPGEQK